MKFILIQKADEANIVKKYFSVFRRYKLVKIIKVHLQNN